jgi:hypothetical protein
VYTHFFDACWTPEDGDKADVADIAIRMMTTGEGPRKDTGNGQGATETNATAAYHSGANPATLSEDEKIMQSIDQWLMNNPGDNPFW